MNDVSGTGSGTGRLRGPGKTSRTSDANFEYDDSEWDVGIGNLIIDLDADIAENEVEAIRSNNSGGTNNSVASNSNSPIHSPSLNVNPSSLTPPTTTQQQMHIPPPSSGPSSGNTSITATTPTPGNNSGSVTSKGNKNSSTSNPSKTGGGVGGVGRSGTGDLSGNSMDLSAAVESNKGLKMKIKRTKTGTKSGADEKHEIVKTELGTGGVNSINNANSGGSTTNSKNSSAGSDSISSKSAHSSSSHKDKDKIKDSGMIMIDADSIVGGLSNHGGGSGSSASTTTNNGISKDSSNPLLSTSVTENGQQPPSSGGKNGGGKTPRKGKEPHTKKVKSSGNNGATNNKKDERTTNNSNSTTSSMESSAKNSISSSHATPTTKEGKDYFSTTVSLNVPNIVPNASSAFSKTTLKVPNSSITRINLEPHAIAAALDSSSRNHSNSLSNNITTNSSWTSGSPKQGGTEKNVNISSSLSTEFKQGQGNGSPSYGKKVKGGDKDKSSKEDGLGLSGLSAIASSYKNSPDANLSSISATVNHTGPSTKGGRNSQSSTTQDVCIGTSVGTVTDPDCLGPCDPGTAVTLEGIVWHENENGILVVNVTWRGKTYVGSLIDCTKNDWAPPRFCDSPTSDLELRTPKNRAKRGRAGQAPTPVNEVQSDLRVGNVKLRNGAKGRRGSATNASFVAPASPLKGILGVGGVGVSGGGGSGDQWPKRKTRGSENESQDEPTPGKATKKLKVSKEERNKGRQLNSPVPCSDLEKSSGPSSPALNLIECPEPNCSKKYKHINGLRYHTSHAHTNFAEDSDSNASTTSTQLAAPSDGGADRPGSEPMVIDNTTCDLDGNESSAMAVDNESSPPPTPSSKRGASNGSLKLGDKSSPYDLHDENARLGDNAKGDGDLLVDLSLSLSGKSGGHKSGPKGHKESGGNETDSKSFESLSKDTTGSSGVLPSRPAILTVPSFISLQNRSVVHSHAALSSSRDQDNSVMKPIPWQPHVHNPVSSGVHHPTYPHPQNSPSSSAPVTLNIPGDKQKEKSSSESHGKKNKHKKKSKDKEGKSSKSDSKGDKSSSKSGGGGRNKFSNLSASETLDGRRGGVGGSSADDLRIPSKRDSEHSFSSDGHPGLGGDNRDDPQSPAYSDISDANDSGDAELIVGGGKDGKGIGGNSDQLKKDAPTIPVAPYFSPFYTPYMEPKDKPVGHVAPLEHDQPEKSKNKSGSHNLPPGPPQHPLSNPMDDNNGRSPKMDFPSPKYLPHQQPHYFHYPYSNYHFEQAGQFNNVMQSDNSFNPPRGFNLDEREKEKEISVGGGDLMKSSKHSHSSDHRDHHRDVKQEPGLGLKDGRLSMSKGQDDKFMGSSEIKSEFGSDPPKSMPHYMQTCSKHSNKESSKRGGSGGDDIMKRGDTTSDKLKDAEKDAKEKEKNEGSKPTMETTGPPPPPTAGSYAYLPQPYLNPGSPFGLPFDPGHPLYRNVLVPGPYGGSPYGMHPGPMPRYPPPPSGVNPIPLPEDLSRSNAPQNPSSSAAKALDLLQHHAQYYQVHKIHELSERALKSPSPHVGQRPGAGGEGRGDPSPGVSPSPNNNPSSPATGGLSGSGSQGGRNSSGSGASGSPSLLSNNKTLSGGGGDLTKELKLGIGGPLPPGGLINESSRSPPTQHHVHSHTHHHTHIGVGYPILPAAFPPPHSPAHYGVLSTPTSGVPTPTVIPPFPSQKPN